MVLIAAFAFVSGCGDKSSKQSNGAGGEADADLAKAAVTVNGTIITEGDVSREVTNLKKQMEGRTSPEQLASMSAMIRKQAVKNLVSRTLLDQAAEKKGLKASKEEVEAKIAEIMKNYPSEEDFNKQLEAGGFTNEEFRTEVKNSVILGKLIDSLTADIGDVDDAAAKKYYEENKDKFVSPEKVRASHILIKVEPTDSDSLKAAKKQKLEGILERLKGGEDFAKLAEQYSDCPSKTSGGDLGYFVRGQMVKPFEDEAFALKTGELSGIVETRFGYHVIKVTDRQPESTTPYEKVKDNIVNYLDNMKKQDKIEDYIDQLKNAATIAYADSADAE